MSSKYAYQLIPESYYFGECTADLGEQIRKLVSDFTNPANLTPETTQKLSRQIEALERLANNVHAKKYTRTLNSTATGLTSEQCSQVLSSEFLQYLNEERTSKRKKSTETH